MEYDFILKTKELLKGLEEKEKQTEFFRNWKNEFFTPSIEGGIFYNDNYERELNMIKHYINMYLSMIDYSKKEFTLEEGNKILSRQREGVYGYINGFIRFLERKMFNRIEEKHNMQVILSELTEKITLEYYELRDDFVDKAYNELVKNNAIRAEMSDKEIVNIIMNYTRSYTGY